MEINKYKNLISRIYLFSDFSPDDISNIFENKFYNIKKYKKNSIIYLQNQICNSIDIVLEGKTSIQKIDEDGDILTIVTYIAGDIMGANLAFSKINEYPMTVTALSNATILHIDKELILNLCQYHKGFLNKFLESISSKAIILTDKINFISMKSIREKIIEFLTYEFFLQNSYNIQLNISKKELAERLGIQRPSLFRELRKMKEEKLIDYNHKSIVILDTKIINSESKN